MLDLTMNLMPWGSDSSNYNPISVELAEEMKVMMKKEDAAYRCRDYILRRKLEQINITVESKTSALKDTQSNDPLKVTNDDNQIDSSCRTTMCEWCYRVVDHFGARRELVEISMNYLDRFLDKFNCDRTAYKLAAITSMYLAIKLYNRKSLTMKSLSTLSRGEFSAVHIAEMECVILQTLSWNLYPPTSANFIYHFHTLLPPIKDSAKQTILQRSCFFAELAVMEYSFVTVNPSDITFAAILNALDGLDVSLMSEEARIAYIIAIEDVSGIAHNSKIINTTREKIWDLYARSAQFELHDVSIATTNESIISSQSHPIMKDGEVIAREMSPICVADV